MVSLFRVEAPHAGIENGTWAPVLKRRELVALSKHGFMAEPQGLWEMHPWVYRRGILWKKIHEMLVNGKENISYPLKQKSSTESDSRCSGG